jgi:hypothetical protein
VALESGRRARGHAGGRHGAQGHLQPAEQDGRRFGTLLVSKGAIEWRPTNKVYKRRLRWGKFDEVMRASGRPV